MEMINDYLPQEVSGKTVLITCGTTGIGRATAILLASVGADVITCGLDEQHLEDALQDIEQTAKGSVKGFIADLGTKEGIQKVFEEVDRHGAPLDILVNNAALPYGSVTEGEYTEWKRIVETNLLGYLGCAGEAVQRMKVNGGGHIVNIGSMSADVREENSSVYVATKSGIQGFSESLRKQVNPLGIKVTVIEPGAVDTDMQAEDTETKKEHVEKGEMMTANDIAMAVLYAISQPKRCDVVELKIRPQLQLI
jgi:NADP-dependent 3-hydroxy acid dehydrogenase YdfG